MSATPQLIASTDAILRIARRRNQGPPPRPLQELVWSMSPSAVASADRLTYTKLVYMMKPLNELDTANVFHALTVPISTESGLLCHNKAEFFKPIRIQHLVPELVVAELLQMGPPHFTFPFWDRSAFANLVIAWRQGHQTEFPIDIVLEVSWIDKSDKFKFLEQVCEAIPCVTALAMWQQNSGRIAAYDGEEEAAKEYPQFLRPALLRALDDADPMHANDVGEFLGGPVAKYPKSLILAAAASGRKAMAIEHILGSLANIMADHPLPQALPFLQQVFDEDSDAILLASCSLLKRADPEMIMRTFQICQALKALPLVVGTLPSTGSFWIQVIAVDNRLLDPAYFEKFLKKQLAAIDSGGLLWAIRNYLDFQVMGITSMQWSHSTKGTIFGALPKLPALLSSVPRLPALFSLAHGAPTKARVPSQDITPLISMEDFAAAVEKEKLYKGFQDLWKWRHNPWQMKHHLVSEFNERGSLVIQKTFLNSRNAKTKVGKLTRQQRRMVNGIMAAIDRADEARKAGFSNQEIWLLYKIQLT